MCCKFLKSNSEKISKVVLNEFIGINRNRVLSPFATKNARFQRFKADIGNENTIVDLVLIMLKIAQNARDIT